MDWSSIGAAGISAIGGYLTAENTNGMKLRDAVRAREWQEYMYNKSMKDMRTNWQLEQAYNTPMAQLRRIEQAGMNPLLLYGQGGVSNVATNSIGAGQMPSTPFGDRQTADVGRYFLSGYEQMRMLNAQTQLMESQANKTDEESKLMKSKTEAQDFQNILNNLTKDLQIQLKFGERDLQWKTIDKYNNEIMNNTLFTWENIRTMAQNRLYQIKQFNLTENQIGEQLKAMWQDVASNRIQANASMKTASANWLHATTEANFSNYQIGELVQRMSFMAKRFPYEMVRLRQGAINDYFDGMLKSITYNQKQYETVNLQLKNDLFSKTGSESFSSSFAPIFFMTGKVTGRIK